MMTVLLLLAVLLGAVFVDAAGLVDARLKNDAAVEQIVLVDDCTVPDAPTPCDGSPVTGTVEYHQGTPDALHLIVTVEDARSSSEYPVLLNDCGSDEVTTCGTILIGSVTTDAEGAGSGEIVVPINTLRAAPFGLPGVHSARISMVKPGAVGRHGRPGVVTATGIVYTIP